MVLPCALWIGLLVFLNITLPILVNRQPERIRMAYDVAWVNTSGQVTVRNLEIRQQSPNDQWLLHVDDATGMVKLHDLLDHTIHITTADAHGASFRWRARADVPKRVPDPSVSVEAIAPAANVAGAQPVVSGGVEPAFQVVPDAPVADWTAPIPGFTNPPDPSPETIYRDATPWRVELEGLHVDGVRELWVGDYQYAGDASVSGALTLEAHKWLEVQALQLQLNGGAVTRGGEPMLRQLDGEVSVDLVGTNPEALEGRDLFGQISAKATLSADVANLAFLDFYLQSAPWLHLSGGVGKLVVDVAVQDGAFQDGSTVAADVQDIAARFLSYSVVGDGKVRLGVDSKGDVAQTALTVDFLDFAIDHDGDAEPHVKGQGFRVSATTADRALDRPFTTLDVALDLPDSQIPDVAVYDAYLPDGLGLRLLAGTGTVSGHLEASTGDKRCHGAIDLHAQGVRATLDDLTLSGDIAVHAVVPTGNLETGAYDISGTSLDLRQVRVISGGSTRDGKDDSTAWWASIKLPKGGVATGAPIFLDGNLDVKFRDTVPFITVFSDKQPLPGWIRGLLGVKPVSGSARIRMGDEVLRVSNFQLFAGQLEVLLELRRRKEMVGKLYARFGTLSLGMALAAGKQNEFQFFNAKDWYDAQPKPD